MSDAWPHSKVEAIRYLLPLRHSRLPRRRSGLPSHSPLRRMHSPLLRMQSPPASTALPLRHRLRAHTPLSRSRPPPPSTARALIPFDPCPRQTPARLPLLAGRLGQIWGAGSRRPRA
ncbi:hypothetical protein PVAP13_6NG014524 [Panicum virgatum]|uniref:Uncharacterized protein n=1 Tax=Panicum virgatum TaxID=38727 RepID=A0A8T0QT57_PANVG|nr:hypothetical protein PVAP13_6NG014524 [Panicum virgatum]